MKLYEITKKIETRFPKELAYEWDNPGLILGDESREINKILLTLDITESVLKEAKENNADLIISHHPLIFSGIKNITSGSRLGKMLLFAAENKISLYCAHTNMDTAEFGINTKLAEMLGFKNAEFIEKNSSFKNAGLGKIGDIEETTLKEFAENVKKTLNTPFVRISGNKNQIIKRAAVGSGSCSELIPQAINMGADVIVTADLKYHTCLDFESDSFSIIDAGHFPTENIVKEMFSEILKGENLIFSHQEDIFKVI